LGISGKKSQYLLAAVRGAEGQSCDFSVPRVYTGMQEIRYETAFIENNLCGKLPIRTGKASNGQPEFRFFNADDAQHQREYRLILTVVRRIREGEVLAPRAKSVAQAQKTKAKTR
jgi:hypothetical protein